MNLGLIIKDKVMMKKLEQMQFFFSGSYVNSQDLGCLGTESKHFKSRIFREPARSGSKWVQKSYNQEVMVS